jgi:hypothetical protein
MDGDCMFSAIAHQLYTVGIDKKLRTAHDVRIEIINYIEHDNSLAASISLGLDEGI